jgi:hypothetical protein
VSSRSVSIKRAKYCIVVPPVVSRTLCSTLYLSDEHRDRNPTAPGKSEKN